MNFEVRSSILDRSRLLELNPEYIEFDDQDHVSKAPTRFLKTDIEGIRYGLKPIRGFSFRIGRIYCIDVRDTSGRIIKIRLNSVYRVRRKHLEIKYRDIIKVLFTLYFHDIIRQNHRQIREGKTIELLGVSLDNEGVWFDKRTDCISWMFLGTRRFWHYFTLYSAGSPENYRTFVFLDDWNAGVLIGLIEMISKEKFPGRRQSGS
jgi:hypothetical protein